MKIDATIIPRQPLKRLVTDPAFMGRIYQLGVNARQKNESLTIVSIDPSRRRKYLLSDIIPGSTSSVGGGAVVMGYDEFYAGIQRIIHLHNHPVAPGWGFFFTGRYR